MVSYQLATNERPNRMQSSNTQHPAKIYRFKFELPIIGINEHILLADGRRYIITAIIYVMDGRKWIYKAAV